MMNKIERRYYKKLARRIITNHYMRSGQKAGDIRQNRQLVDELIRQDADIDLIMRCMYNDMLPSYTGDVETKSDEERKMRAYRYVPSSRHDFVRNVLPVFADAKSFIDVGAGYADKVALASLYGNFDVSYGIEMNDYTYNVSLFLLSKFFNFDRSDIMAWERDRRYACPAHYAYKPLGEIILKHGNAFDYDFGKHDAVYMYMPIADKATLNKLHVHVINTMPKGGILYEVGGGWFVDHVKYNHATYCGITGCDCCDRPRAIFNSSTTSRERDRIERVYTYKEYAAEYLDTPIKRDIRVFNNGHCVEAL
jgi:hypothetical protein